MRGAVGRASVYGRIAGHLAMAAAKVGLCFSRWSEERQGREITEWSAKAVTIFDIQIVVNGRPPTRERPCLIVANHVSWLDVYCVLSQSSVAFVAKTEVRDWPVIGSLASRLDTIFVSRERSGLGREVKEISARLAEGRSICVFPEGTSSDGSTALPFRAACFEAAIATRVPVQPVAIRYLRSDGTRAEEVVFAGDTTLLESFCRLARTPGLTAEVRFLDPIEPRGLSRRDLARQAEIAIRTTLHVSPDAQLDQAA